MRSGFTLPSRRRSMRPPEESLARVALLMGPGTNYGRLITIGASLYARPTRSWLFNTAPPQSAVVDRLRQWRPAGVIAHIADRQLADRLQELAIPVVNVSNMFADLPFPRIGVDDVAVGTAAAQHFLDRGYEHFAFCGINDCAFSRLRGESFCASLATRGYQAYNYAYPQEAVIETAGALWGTEADQLRQWLLSLPRPTGIFTAVDHLGFALGEVCTQSGLHVPEEFALLGVDNDEVACELAYPRLSSIGTPSKRIGYEAAKLLDALMHQHPIPAQPILFPPAGVTVRHSTDVMAIDDPYIAGAMRYIREHANENIAVTDVAMAAGASRRSLERRFRDRLGRTVLDEIRRARVDKAKKLLSEYGLTITEIAAQSGFCSSSRLSTVFRELTGKTPTEYRAHQRRR